MWSYEPLWKTMEEKQISQYSLINNHVINSATIHRLRKGGSITMVTLQKICFALDCTPNDVIEFIKEEGEE